MLLKKVQNRKGLRYNLQIRIIVQREESSHFKAANFGSQLSAKRPIRSHHLQQIEFSNRLLHQDLSHVENQHEDRRLVRLQAQPLPLPDDQTVRSRVGQKDQALLLEFKCD